MGWDGMGGLLITAVGGTLFFVIVIVGGGNACDEEEPLREHCLLVCAILEKGGRDQTEAKWRKVDPPPPPPPPSSLKAIHLVAFLGSGAIKSSIIAQPHNLGSRCLRENTREEAEGAGEKRATDD